GKARPGGAKRTDRDERGVHNDKAREWLRLLAGRGPAISGATPVYQRRERRPHRQAALALEFSSRSNREWDAEGISRRADRPHVLEGSWKGIRPRCQKGLSGRSMGDDPSGSLCTGARRAFSKPAEFRWRPVVPHERGSYQ